LDGDVVDGEDDNVRVYSWGGREKGEEGQEGEEPAKHEQEAKEEEAVKGGVSKTEVPPPAGLANTCLPSLFPQAVIAAPAKPGNCLPSTLNSVLPPTLPHHCNKAKQMSSPFVLRAERGLTLGIDKQIYFLRVMAAFEGNPQKGDLESTDEPREETRK